MTANELLAESLDLLVELGDQCDHSVGICWCGHWVLCQQIAEYLDAQSFPHRQPGKRG